MKRNEETTNNKRWLTPTELEAEYGFSKSTQAKMRMISNKYTIPFSKVGKFIRYLVCNYFKYEDLHKRPLSKLVKDISEELGLIVN